MSEAQRQAMNDAMRKKAAPTTANMKAQEMLEA